MLWWLQLLVSLGENTRSRIIPYGTKKLKTLIITGKNIENIFFSGLAFVKKHLRCKILRDFDWNCSDFFVLNME